MSQEEKNGSARTWLITGASSGLGYALARYVLEQGDRVAMGARTLDTMADLAARYPGRALALTLDVTSAETARGSGGAADGARALGDIDVLVNNAAIDFIGAIEEQDERDYRAQFEVNFFGAVALLRLVLPGMRARKRGTIVNVSSMDGIASVPVNGYYSSTKFAIEGLTETLWQELEPLGLRALLVEPGSFRTGIEQRTKFSGKTIDDHTAATSGAFRAMVEKVTPGHVPWGSRPRRRSDLPGRGLGPSAALGRSGQRRAATRRGEARDAAGRDRGRQGHDPQHRLPRRWASRPLGIAGPPTAILQTYLRTLWTLPFGGVADASPMTVQYTHPWSTAIDEGRFCAEA